MGKDTSIFDLHKELALPISAPLTVIAGRHHLDELRSSAKNGWLDEALLIECDVDETIPFDDVPESGVAIVEVSPVVAGSMSRIEQFHAKRPDVTLVVAMAEADLRTVRMLVREGVADVVALPFAPEEIFETLVAVLETSQPAQEEQVRLAPVVGLLRATGGAGATTVASHLAAALADEGARSVCLLDLDIQSGRVAEVMGVSPRRTLGDLLDAGPRLDATLLRSVATRHSSGVDVIAAPSDILPIESIQDEALSRLLDIVRREYDLVVVDFAADLTNWSLSLLARSDAVIPIVEQSLGSLRHTRRILDLFQDLGLDRRLVLPVVNKVHKKLFKSISVSDVGHALGRDVSATLSLEPQAMTAAQDQGLLLGEAKSKSAFLSDIEKLSDLVLTRCDAGETQ